MRWKKTCYIFIGGLILYDCLFVWGLSSHSRFFTHMETLLLLVMTYARHSCPWNSEGSFACHTYCDTMYLFVWPMSYKSVAKSLWVELSLPFLTTYMYVCRGWDSNTRPSACESNSLTVCGTAKYLLGRVRCCRR